MNRWGSTASDTLQARADEGGIAPQDYENQPVPLTHQRSDGRVAASWFVVIVATLGLLAVGIAWVVRWAS